MSHKQDLLDVHKLHKVNMLFLTRSLFHAKTMTVPIHIEIFHHQPRCRKNTCQALVVHQATPWGRNDDDDDGDGDGVGGDDCDPNKSK